MSARLVLDNHFRFEFGAGAVRRAGGRIASSIAVAVFSAFAVMPMTWAQEQALVLQVTTADGTNPIYRPGSVLEVILRSNREAYVQCYYVAADGSVAMVFPNKDQPDYRVPGGEPITIPPHDGDFKIRLSKELSFETVACFGSLDDTRSWIPPEFSIPLETIQGVSYSDLEQTLLSRKSREEIAKGSVTAVVSQ